MKGEIHLISDPLPIGLGRTCHTWENVIECLEFLILIVPLIWRAKDIL